MGAGGGGGTRGRTQDWGAGWREMESVVNLRGEIGIEA